MIDYFKLGIKITLGLIGLGIFLFILSIVGSPILFAITGEPYIIGSSSDFGSLAALLAFICFALAGFTLWLFTLIDVLTAKNELFGKLSG